jgi:cytochrome P450
MSVAAEPAVIDDLNPAGDGTAGLVGTVASSPAGPADPDAGLSPPPTVALPHLLQVLRFNGRHGPFVFGARRRHGEVFSVYGLRDRPITVTSHPDHARSLFIAKPQPPTLTGESSLRPVLGDNSVLIANEPRHMRQRKALLPPFHGEAVARYTDLIADAADENLAKWPIGRPFALAPQMQRITLDVIMGGIFGIRGRPAVGTPEHALRVAISRLSASASPWLRFELVINSGRERPIGFTWAARNLLDALLYRVIRERRRSEHLDEREDILSLLLQTTTEDGERLTDAELRDELLTLVLAGFETTANTLAWTWERLTRTPAAYDRLRDAVRSRDRAEEHIEATIIESMRSRPVIPMVARSVTAPWRLGEYVIPEGTSVAISILLLHHREDLYPEPFAFRPERFIDHKPGTYEWIPFGGGTRRCLGATLALAEMRIVLERITVRYDLEAAEPEPERAMHRSVTMIPRHGARVIARRRSTPGAAPSGDVQVSATAE